MTSEQLQAVLRAGASQGWMPADATLPTDDTRPWPLVLLTALGAWLAAIPLFGFFAMLLGPALTQHGGAYVVGVPVLGVAALVLRQPGLPVFVEQLAVPGLLTGMVSLAFGLFRDLPHQTASALMMAVCVALIAFLPRAWLRVLLGAAAAILLMLAVQPGDLWRNGHRPLAFQWLALHAALAVWCMSAWLQRAGRIRAATAMAIEAAGAGWFVAVVVGLALWSGMTFLVAGSLGGNLAADIARELATRPQGTPVWWLLRAVSAGLGAAAIAWTAHAWPALRGVRTACIAAVLVVLCGFLPALGGAMLALALALTSGRWLLAGFAGLGAAWIVGSFYYQLQWTLADKALVLAAAGAALAAIAWTAPREHAPAARASFAARPAALVASAAVLALLVANVSIWQKEALIAEGRALFVELAPVDPRSLMQGDYMRLNWRLPTDGEDRLRQLVTLERPHVIAMRDQRGVARLLRVTGSDAPVGPDELRIELTPKGGRWVLVTDAWYFREGQAQRWARARYGEFRVGSDGRALLVGLADAELRPLRD